MERRTRRGTATEWGGRRPQPRCGLDAGRTSLRRPCLIARLSHTLLLAVPLALVTVSAAEDWTRFRGPNGSGLADGHVYPNRIGPPNLVWRTAVRPAKSSPVLTDDHIFVTAFGDGQLWTQCFDRRSGKLLWERAESRLRRADLNRLNQPAAISPVTDGENVYVLFRDFGLVSYDAAGNLRWKTALDAFANSMGQTSSPIIAGGQLIVQADQKLNSYLAAFDLANGEIRWKTARQEGESWSTPLAHAPPNASEQLITVSRGWAAGHSLTDGRIVWRQSAVGPAVVASAVASNQTIYAFSYGNEPSSNFEGAFTDRDQDGDGLLTSVEYGTHAFMAGVAKYDGDRDRILSLEEWLTAARATIAPSSLVALRFSDGRDAPRELWRYERSFIGVIPSPLVYQGVLYLIKNGGILDALSAETGRVLKRGRIRQAVEGYSSSPVAADGKIYLAGEAGNVSVLRAQADWQVLNVNNLGEPIFATPALSQGQVFIRTDQALYCFGANQNE